MATKDMERVSHLEGAYEHMATKAELAIQNGDNKVQFARFEHQFELIERRFEAIEKRLDALEAAMHSVQEVLVQILERLERLENLNTRALGFQTENRTLRDDSEDYDL